jgi:hypothetical protein
MIKNILPHFHSVTFYFPKDPVSEQRRFIHLIIPCEVTLITPKHILIFALRQEIPLQYQDFRNYSLTWRGNSWSNTQQLVITV